VRESAREEIDEGDRQFKDAHFQILEISLLQAGGILEPTSTFTLVDLNEQRLVHGRRYVKDVNIIERHQGPRPRK